MCSWSAANAIGFVVSARPLVLESVRCEVMERTFEIFSGARELNDDTHCRFQRDLIWWAEAGCGPKLPMKTQDGFYGADANAALEAQPLTFIATLEIKAAGREEVGCAWSGLCSDASSDSRTGEANEP